METKVYNVLPEDAVFIRNTVFVEEQGFKEEFDQIDGRAVHMVMYDKDNPVAVCRFFKDTEPDTYIIGRIAVIKKYRGQAIGMELMSEAEKAIKKAGGKKICLHAQERVKPFYEKQGYYLSGINDYDEGCPHVWMHKELDCQENVKS